MNKEAILTFIKKNILSLSCALVAILAVVALFYPLGGMVTDLQTNTDSQAATYGQLTELTRQRKLPMSDPNQADPGTLPIFPNPATVKAGQEANAKWISDCAALLSSIQALNQAGHDLLAGTDELPNPQLDSTYFSFKKLYSLVLSTDPSATALGNPNAIPPVGPDATLQAAGKLNLQNDVLKGGLPPTPEEIRKASEDRWTNIYQPQVQTRNGVEINKADLDEKFAKDVATLPLLMKSEMAKKHKIYVESNAFTLNSAIVQVDKPLLMDIWYAQMQLWIQQDLANAIKEENSKATSILDAPIKRLIAMQVPSAPMYVFPPATAAAGGGGPGGAGNVPAAVDQKQPIPPIYSVSLTGRYSNGMYDVVPFKLVIDVDASKLNEVLEALSYGRQITITNQNMFALDTQAESDKGYLYGPGSVVRLQLDGEEIFLRSWTAPLMPDRVKQALGLIAGGPGAAAGPGAGPAGAFGSR